MNFMKSTLPLLWLLAAWPALADLSATVQPGYVFGPNERPNTATLNRLGQPTITISGTIGGTNAGLAAASVNGTHLSDTIVDGTNITFNGASPRALTIVDSGVDVTQISSNIAGLALIGGSGAALDVNVDDETLVIEDDVLKLATNLPPSRLNVTNNHVVVGTEDDVGVALPISQVWTQFIAAITYTTPEVQPAQGMSTNWAHGLGVTPTWLRIVWVCKTADAGYVPGDEVEPYLFWTDDYPFVSGGVNSSNVFLYGLVTGHPVATGNKNTGVGTLITLSRWRVKAYVRP